MKKILIYTTVLTIFLSFISCNTGNETESEKKQETKTEQKKDCKDVHWSHHSGEDGPENWKNLCEGFSDCGGRFQSPVNIITDSIAENSNLAAITFNYGDSKVNIINNSHTVQFNISGENNITINNRKYKLLQFHFHTSSEHTVNGNYFPAEVHFVHQSEDGNYAVIAAFYEEGEENELFKMYMKYFPTAEGEYTSEDKFDILSLLPENKSYYYYKGSLTTPPCSETVSWYILKNNLSASKEQLEEFAKILDNNFRPIQKLNGRKIEEYTE